MNLFRRAKYNCYCAFCRSPRRVTRQRHIGLMNVIASFLVSAVMMEVFWAQFDPRAVVFFAFCLAIAEMFIQFRWRFSIACKICGFDPVLYLKDPAKAVSVVTEKLEVRRNSPEKILARPLNLPTIAPSRAEELKQMTDTSKKGGTLLSRSI